MEEATLEDFYNELDAANYQKEDEVMISLENDRKSTTYLQDKILHHIRTWERMGLVKSRQFPISTTLKQYGFRAQMEYIRTSELQIEKKSNKQNIESRILQFC